MKRRFTSRLPTRTKISQQTEASQKETANSSLNVFVNLWSRLKSAIISQVNMAERLAGRIITLLSLALIGRILRWLTELGILDLFPMETLNQIVSSMLQDM